jgi:DNA-binding XRE family transcriptional regulator
MPPNLRLCFAYCAIFPKGHIIVKDQIIHQWNALGFIEQSDIFSTRQLGEAYVRQLLGLCFLQQTKAPSVSFYLPHASIAEQLYHFFISL